MFYEAINKFASEDGPHVSLKAEPVFEVAGFTVSNSMLYGAIISIFTFVVLYYAAQKTRVKPVGGLTQLIEMGYEFIIDTLDSVFKSREKAIQYAPFFSIFFMFILFSNLSGLMPIVGGGLTVGEGTLFRPFTADLNSTIAISLVGVGLVQYLAIKESGFGGHLKHFFTDKPFNPINFGIGILEVFGEFTRVLSLSLRLFLNTAIGEALISIFTYLGKDASTLTIIPIVLFEILVALIQAYVFTILCSTYLALAIAHGHDDHAHEESQDSTNQPNAPELSPGGVPS